MNVAAGYLLVVGRAGKSNPTNRPPETALPVAGDHDNCLAGHW